MNNNVTVIHKDSTNPELEVLLARFPYAAIHDDVHYVFADVSAIEDAIDISELVDEEGNKLEGDALVWVLAKILTMDDSSVLHMNRSQVQSLHNHPAWRIWCANYSEEDRDQFESDWNYITQLLAEKKPEASSAWPAYSEAISYEYGKNILFEAINTNTDI